MRPATHDEPLEFFAVLILWNLIATPIFQAEPAR
jgi:hypothetical protein